MSVGDSYATVAQLKEFLEWDHSDTGKDLALNRALTSATEEVDNYCGRTFNTSGVAEDRVYRIRYSRFVEVDDFHDTDSLVVRIAARGQAFGDPWVLDEDFDLEPENGPVYQRVVLAPTRYLPWYDSRMQVTATFGWPTVPAPVTESCLIVAAMNVKLGSAPLGVAGFDKFGQSVRVQDSSVAASKLDDYVTSSVLVG